jgi:predicted amidophosphoribosyltransferase
MVAGAFTVHEKRRSLLNGRHILLVDDVYTSGATTDACIRVLKKGGASAVTILCWTRVLPLGLETANPT